MASLKEGKLQVEVSVKADDDLRKHSDTFMRDLREILRKEAQGEDVSITPEDALYLVMSSVHSDGLHAGRRMDKASALEIHEQALDNVRMAMLLHWEVRDVAHSGSGAEELVLMFSNGCELTVFVNDEGKAEVWK